MDEKRLVKVNAKIVERFDNDEEVIMVKGGGFWDVLGKLADKINIVNCQCNRNNAINCCSGGSGQTQEDIKQES